MPESETGGYPDHRWVGWVAGLTPIACLAGLVSVWPTIPPAPNLGPAWLTDEARMFLVAALAGALGGALQMARSYAGHLGGGNWDGRWLAWYGLRIPAGIGLALLFYMALRAGFYNNANGTAAVNPFGVAVLSALAGLFSREALEKLDELFDTLTGRPATPPADTRRLPAPVDTAAVPAPTPVPADRIPAP
ncbi:hypothetical protein [Paracoccus sp. SSK6]|uniref:hypothetical protein n=1 Tax=Paracoccus sp. SSK6 TaxID=3143131 RepID=UPI0032199A42